MLHTLSERVTAINQPQSGCGIKRDQKIVVGAVAGYQYGTA
jgi:hypothetical protein